MSGRVLPYGQLSSPTGGFRNLNCSVSLVELRGAGHVSVAAMPPIANPLEGQFVPKTSMSVASADRFLTRATDVSQKAKKAGDQALSVVQKWIKTGIGEYKEECEDFEYIGIRAIEASIFAAYRFQCLVLPEGVLGLINNIRTSLEKLGNNPVSHRDLANVKALYDKVGAQTSFDGPRDVDVALSNFLDGVKGGIIACDMHHVAVMSVGSIEGRLEAVKAAYEKLLAVFKPKNPGGSGAATPLAPVIPVGATPAVDYADLEQARAAAEKAAKEIASLWGGVRGYDPKSDLQNAAATTMTLAQAVFQKVFRDCKDDKELNRLMKAVRLAVLFEPSKLVAAVHALEANLESREPTNVIHAIQAAVVAVKYSHISSLVHKVVVNPQYKDDPDACLGAIRTIQAMFNQGAKKET